MFFRLIGALGYTVRTHKSFLWYKDQLWNPIHKISHCRGCRVQCRVTKIVPLVHKPTLVSYKNVPSIIVRSKQSLKAPKSQISLSGIFFETPCTLRTFPLIKVLITPSNQVPQTRQVCKVWQVLPRKYANFSQLSLLYVLLLLFLEPE